MLRGGCRAAAHARHTNTRWVAPTMTNAGRPNTYLSAPSASFGFVSTAATAASYSAPAPPAAATPHHHSVYGRAIRVATQVTFHQGAGRKEITPAKPAATTTSATAS